jgi:hypothetical protein
LSIPNRAVPGAAVQRMFGPHSFDSQPERSILNRHAPLAQLARAPLL